jgi:hypothetical protein
MIATVLMLFCSVLPALGSGEAWFISVPVSNVVSEPMVGNSLETQYCSGGRVEIVEARGTWVRIAAVEQPSRKDKRCYPGWIYGSNVSSYRYVRPAFVTEDISRAYGDPEATQNRAPCFSGAGSIFLAILAAWPA